MRNPEKYYAYPSREAKREARRQVMGSIAMLLLVLGLAAVCAIAYYHARGGFTR